MTGQAARPAGEGRLVVGLIRGVHGLRGAVRVELLTDEPSRFEPGGVMYAEGSDEPLTVVEARRDGPGLIVRFAEVADRTAAESLRETYLEAHPAADRPAETWYWHEIVGCQVVTVGGEALGRVEEVMRVGGAEVYVVRGRRGELLVPAVRSVVVEMAPAEGRIVVDAIALGLEGG